MKKLSLAVLFIISMMHFAFSQTNYIYNTGNVGIGTTNPVKLLSLFNGTDPSIRQATTNYIYLTGPSADDGIYHIARADGITADRLTILANGNVGIGTTTPGQLLTLQSNTGTIRLQAASDPTGYYTDIVNNWNSSYPFYMGINGYGRFGVKKLGLVTPTDLAVSFISGVYGIAFATNAADPVTGNIRMSILANGNVGIGTTTPSALLHNLGTTEQLRLGYDASNYASFTVGSSGTLTLNNTGTSTGLVVNTPTAFTSSVTIGTSATNLWVPSAVGIANTTAPAYLFGGASTINFRNGFYGSNSITLGTGNSYGAMILASAPLTTASSGTHNWLANEVVNPIGTVTSGGAAITNTASLYISGASTVGTNNYALYSTSGNNYFGGNVGIGTSNNQGYTLAVNGSVIATAVTVKLYANWPDYVFSKNYHLPALSDVKTYIDKNHHLPDMPSEKEVAKDGINLGEMNKLLTKKVEELTLYLIDKDNKEREQEKKMNNQQVQLSAQQAQIDQLNKALAELLKNKTSK